MTLKIVLAPDSFKESMSAKEVCVAMEVGIKKALPDVEIIHVPMADGGEGTVDALVDATAGEKIEETVSGPFPEKKVTTYFGILGDKKTAVIEMAKANGIELIAPEDRNPLKTSTYGTGELILAAIEQGVEKIVIGIGGSVTNDGGAGMAAALGIKFLNQEKEEIPLGGGSLDQLAHLDISQVDPRLKKVKILIASDVTNPLTGESGASAVFGPQKGATEEMVQQLDQNLAHYAQVIRQDLGIEIEHVPGAGAAGGLGAGLLAFTNSKLRAGIDVVTEVTGLEEYIKTANFVFTGEGGMDYQTKFGKAPYGVAKVGKKYHKPVFACAGYIGENVEVLYDEGMTAIFSILPKATTLSEALSTGKENLARTTENIARVLALYN